MSNPWIEAHEAAEQTLESCWLLREAAETWVHHREENESGDFRLRQDCECKWQELQASALALGGAITQSVSICFSAANYQPIHDSPNAHEAIWRAMIDLLGDVIIRSDEDADNMAAYILTHLPPEETTNQLWCLAKQEFARAWIMLTDGDVELPQETKKSILRQRWEFETKWYAENLPNSSESQRSEYAPRMRQAYITSNPDDALVSAKDFNNARARARAMGWTPPNSR